MKQLLLFTLIFILTLSYASRTGAETSVVDIYTIGPNDIIDIKVLDHHDLRTTTTVSLDGAITFPYIGTLVVKGMSLSEIEETITKQLREGYIQYPVVTVALVRSLSKKFYAYGELRKTGQVPLEENITVLKALSIVGGVTNNGMFGKLKIRRKIEKGSDQHIDIAEGEFNDGILMDKKVENMIVQPDDILLVERNKTFLIQGEVRQRGRFDLEKNMTVLGALLQAGGVTGDGLYGTIKVRRKEMGEFLEYKDISEAKLNDGVIDNKKVENMIVQADDILLVERNKTFLIQGEVMKRGRFILEKGMTVLRALLQAGGVTKDGLHGTIKIRRKLLEQSDEYKNILDARLNDGVIDSKKVENMILQPDDILFVERNKTILIQGEVIKRGRFDLEKDMTVLGALLQAGGVTKDGLYGKIKVRRKEMGEYPEYKEISEAKLNNGVIENREVENLILQTDDILIVERNRTFFIYGEVNRTGEFVLDSDMTVFKAITIAGGFTKWGSGNRVKILRVRNDGAGFMKIKVNIEDVIKGDAAKDILLESGDKIVVSSGVF